MFIDALTPAEPPPPIGPVSEHDSGPKLGISAAQNDLHVRVHGDGTACPVCLMRVQTAQGPLPILRGQFTFIGSVKSHFGPVVHRSP
jgi:hypothetical protein